ncbi:MAG: hypothetical protein ACRCTQ_05150 [Brevinemataceae bacterium]
MFLYAKEYEPFKLIREKTGEELILPGIIQSMNVQCECDWETNVSTKYFDESDITIELLLIGERMNPVDQVFKKKYSDPYKELEYINKLFKGYESNRLELVYKTDYPHLVKRGITKIRFVDFSSSENIQRDFLSVSIVFQEVLESTKILDSTESEE